MDQERGGSFQPPAQDDIADDPMNFQDDLQMKRRKKKPKKMRLCGEDIMTAEERAESEFTAYKTRADVNKLFK